VRDTSGGSANTAFQVGLGVTAWEIDFFGRLASLNQVALDQYLASEEGVRAVQVALVSNVASSWLSLAADDELIAVTQQTLQTREESLRLIRLRSDNGVSSELDVQLAGSLVETARATLAQQQRQRAVNLNALGFVTGKALPSDYAPGVRLADVKLPELAVGIPSEVLTKRPDVLQAEAQLKAANANIGAARAALLPRISLTASAGSASNQLSGLFGSGSYAYTIAPSLLQTVFDSGRSKAGVETATAQRDAAIAQYERAIQSAFREVADALDGRQRLDAQLQAQARVAQADAQRLRLVQMRQDRGVSTSLDFLDAQRSVFASRQSEIQVRLARLHNQTNLFRALGGGVE
jgi:outer membrane protein, multidrug efflux system